MSELIWVVVGLTEDGSGEYSEIPKEAYESKDDAMDALSNSIGQGRVIPLRLYSGGGNDG